MLYLGWFDDNPKRAIADRIADGRAAYLERFGVAPKVVILNESHRDDRIEVANMIVLFKPFIRRNNYWFGMSDC